MDYGKYLVDEILPHWLEIKKDTEYGGIFTSFDENANVKSTDKTVWFFGRELWSYSLAWRQVEQRPEYLDICEHIYQFLKKCTPPGGRLPYVVTREGKPKVQREVYYSEMFCAMGCAQYYRICGREEVWESACLYFDTLFALYRENRNTNQEPGYEEACKTFGLHMAMIPTVQFMRNVGRDTEKYDAAMDMVLHEMMTGGFLNEEKKQVNEYRPLGNEPLKTWLADMCYPGHVYEGAWFVLSEGELRNDDRIRAFGRKLLDCAMDEGFEEITDLIPTDRILSKPLAEDLIDRYLAWPQEEAAIAYRLAYHMFGEEKYLKLSRWLEKTAFEYFADREAHRWYEYINKSDGKVAQRTGKSGHIMGPFHLERMLLVFKCIDETGSIRKYLE